jgi:RhoGAP domain
MHMPQMGRKKKKKRKNKHKHDGGESTSASSSSSSSSSSASSLSKRNRKRQESTRDLSETAVFGVPVDLAARRSDPVQTRKLIPAPLALSIEWLDKTSLSDVGIYRVPGESGKFEQYRQRFDAGERVDFDALGEQFSQNVTMLVTRFVKMIPGSIFTDKYVRHFGVALQLGNAEQKKAVLRGLMLALPLENRETLHFLAAHLRRVADNSERNKMSVANIAITWGISLGPVIGNVLKMLIENEALCPETVVFGVPLDVAAERTDAQRLIPSPVRLCINHLELAGCFVAECWTVGTSERELAYWRHLFDSGSINPSELPAVSIVAALIRRFLDELPGESPLLSDELRAAFARGDGNGASIDSDELQALLVALPPASRATLGKVIGHLAQVVEFSTITAGFKDDDAAVMATAVRVASRFTRPEYRGIFPLLIARSQRLFCNDDRRSRRRRQNSVALLMPLQSAPEYARIDAASVASVATAKVGYQLEDAPSMSSLHALAAANPAAFVSTRRRHRKKGQQCDGDGDGESAIGGAPLRMVALPSASASTVAATGASAKQSRASPPFVSHVRKRSLSTHDSADLLLINAANASVALAKSPSPQKAVAASSSSSSSSSPPSNASPSAPSAWFRPATPTDLDQRKSILMSNRMQAYGGVAELRHMPRDRASVDCGEDGSMGSSFGFDSSLFTYVVAKDIINLD